MKSVCGDLGVRVISLPEQPELPDAVFVEDPLVVVDEVAVVAPMGAEAAAPSAKVWRRRSRRSVHCAGCTRPRSWKAAT